MQSLPIFLLIFFKSLEVWLLVHKLEQLWETFQ